MHPRRAIRNSRRRPASCGRVWRPCLIVAGSCVPVLVTTCTATDTFAGFWVGLDGDGTNTVEQTGTEADCDGGAATYQGWFEMFPAAPVFYDNLVEPGDAMSASVVADATADQTAIGNQNPSALTLVSANDVTEATPCALTARNAFTVTWNSNGATGTPGTPGTGIPPGRHHHHHWFGG